MGAQETGRSSSATGYTLRSRRRCKPVVCFAAREGREEEPLKLVAAKQKLKSH
jgi:hypothetical protein